MHISRRRIISFLILFTAFLALPLTGCGGGTSGDQATSPGSPASIGKTDTVADTSTAREEEIEPAPKRLGIKPFWPYDTNAVGGGGKAMTNLASGNFLLQYTDVSFPGRGLPVEIRRTYNSLNGAKGYFGKGWSCIFDSHLVFNETIDETTNETTIDIILVDAYGGRFKFTEPQPSGSDTVYKAPPGRNTIFKKLADGTYSEKKKNGSTYLFDTTGKLVKLQHRNANNSLQFIYDANGFPMGIHEASGRDTSIVCDESGHITSITDPQQRDTSYFYAGNRLRKVVDPHHYRTLFEYNESGLLTTINTPRGFQSSIVYDEQNRITEFHDPLYIASYQYFDDQTQVSDTYGHHLVYYLNTAGNTTLIVDSMGFITTMGYDANDRMTVRWNLITTENFAYDPLGNVTRKSTGLGAIDYGYDDLNRLTSVAMPGRTVSYTLDNNGNRTASNINDSTGAWSISNMSFTYSYDDDNRLTWKEKKLQGFPVEHLSLAYDTNNNLTTLQVNALWGGNPITHSSKTPGDLNFSFTYAYNELDQQTSVTNSNQDTYNATFDDVGNMTGITYPGGSFIGNSTSQRTFDQENRITRVSNDYIPATQGQGPVHFQYDYSYDNNSNCTSVTVEPTISGIPGPRTYRYDELGRLKYDQNAMMAYEYDDAGNKTRDILYTDLVDTLQENVNYTFNNAHQLLSIITDKALDPNRPWENEYDHTRWSYEYDANGNVNKKSFKVPDYWSNYHIFYFANTFNPMNRLTEIQCHSVYYDISNFEGHQYTDRIQDHTRQNFDDNDEVIFQFQRMDSDTNAYRSNTSLLGYYNGSLLYKTMTAGESYYYGSYTLRGLI
jgi:YD repeat-containing protein